MVRPWVVRKHVLGLPEAGERLGQTHARDKQIVYYGLPGLPKLFIVDLLGVEDDLRFGVFLPRLSNRRHAIRRPGIVWR